MANTDKYVALITSEHANQPNFVASIRALCQGFADTGDLSMAIPQLFNLDLAVGSQLDAVGLWVGLSRILPEPLPGVYFSWDSTVLLGWDSGSWKSIYDSTTGLTTVPDDSYRNLLKAKIAANNWDGTIPGAQAVYLAIFNGGVQVIIQDNQDMSYVLGFVGAPPTAVEQALLANGYIPLKPAGVRVVAIALPLAPGPLFAWDAVSTTLNGWQVGQWTLEIHPT